MARSLRILALLSAGLVALAGPGTASAAAFAFYFFTGEVTSVAPELASAFTVGDPVTVSVAIDLATPDGDPDPTRGEYVGPTVAATFGSYEISGNSPGSSAVVVQDGLVDEFRVSGVGAVGPDVGMFSPDVVSIVLEDDSATAFTHTGLPPTLDLARFDIRTIRLIFSNDGPTPAPVLASVTGVSLPEPGCGAACVAAVLALALRRRAS